MDRQNPRYRGAAGLGLSVDRYTVPVDELRRERETVEKGRTGEGEKGRTGERENGRTETCAHLVTVSLEKQRAMNGIFRVAG
jgi:hypothetical protein